MSYIYWSSMSNSLEVQWSPILKSSELPLWKSNELPFLKFNKPPPLKSNELPLVKVQWATSLEVQWATSLEVQWSTSLDVNEKLPWSSKTFPGGLMNYCFDPSRPTFYRKRTVSQRKRENAGNPGLGPDCMWAYLSHLPWIDKQQPGAMLPALSPAYRM